MARLKKTVKVLLWGLCAVPVMATFLAIAVMTDYVERGNDGS